MSTSKPNIRLGFLGSLLIHGLLSVILVAAKPPEKVKQSAVKVRAAIAQPVLDLPKPEPPKAEPVEAPKPEPPKPEVVKPKPKPKKKRKVLRKPKLKKRTPKPKEEAPPPPPAPAPKPVGFSVDLSATSKTGGIAAPAVEGGGNVIADASITGLQPGQRGAGDGDEGEGTKTAPVEVDVVTRMPKKIKGPSSAQFLKYYPKQARKLSQEADVKMKILINEKGRVERSIIVSSGGREFDRAAKKLTSYLRFKPAKQGDEAVAVWLPWTMKFRINE